jgi:Zn-dependent protease
MKTSPLINFFILLVLIQLLLGGGFLRNFFTNPQTELIFLLCLLIALVIHEFSHALAADRLGDPNPRLAGRLSLNPLKHLDPLGTLLIIFARFGWGKPVAFDPYNLQHPVRDGAWIAAAGPLSNLILATLAGLAIRFLPLPPPFAIYFLLPLFSLNLGLALFNLLPVFPLDGHHILRAFLPRSSRAAYDLFNRHFGYIVTLIILFIPLANGQTLVDLILSPALAWLATTILGI